MTDTEDADEPTDPPKNTLYRKIGKGRRRLTPARMLMYRVAVVVG